MNLLSGKKNGERPAQVHFAFIIIADILLIGISLCVFALFHHVLPQNTFDSSTVNEALTNKTFPEITEKTARVTESTCMQASAPETAATVQTETSATAVGSQCTTSETDPADGVFTNGEIISDETTYKSKNVSVSLCSIEKDGKEFFVIDARVRSMANLAAAVVPEDRKDEYVHVMAAENKAVCAINGDYFGLVKGGSAIRNGCILSTGSDNDVCAIYVDGRMEIFPRGSFDEETELLNGAWHAWDFGPSLLDENGKAIKSFKTRNDIDGRNPRTAIGYYEPGHYCFVTVGGRKKGSAAGVTLESLSKLFEELGCVKAYNLDGGKSAVMTFGDTIVNEYYNGEGRKNTDIIYIRDTED